MIIINVFQSHDQNIDVLVEGMFHSILHFVYHVVPKSHDHHYRFQSHNQSIVVLVDGMFHILYPELSFPLSSTIEGMFHSILHFVYHVIFFNFYLRKIVLQEMVGVGGSFLREK
jgi:hypothetical protein